MPTALSLLASLHLPKEAHLSQQQQQPPTPTALSAAVATGVIVDVDDSTHAAAAETASNDGGHRVSLPRRRRRSDASWAAVDEEGEGDAGDEDEDSMVSASPHRFMRERGNSKSKESIARSPASSYLAEAYAPSIQSLSRHSARDTASSSEYDDDGDHDEGSGGFDAADGGWTVIERKRVSGSVPPPMGDGLRRLSHGTQALRPKAKSLQRSLRYAPQMTPVQLQPAPAVPSAVAAAASAIPTAGPPPVSFGAAGSSLQRSMSDFTSQLGGPTLVSSVSTESFVELSTTARQAPLPSETLAFAFANLPMLTTASEGLWRSPSGAIGDEDLAELNEDDEDDDSPALLSPASSFLSAFSSPRSSGVFPASAKPVASDEQGQPAGLPGSPYVLGKLIGKGSTSVVREVLDAQTQARLTPPQAVKVVLAGVVPAFRMAEELALWTAVSSHPNVLTLLKAVDTPRATFLFMPHAIGGSLFDLVKRHREHDRARFAAGGAAMTSSFRGRTMAGEGAPAGHGLPEAEARKLFKGVVAGVKALHDAGILHGDLKGENVMIDAQGCCKLADFGMAVRFRQPINANTSTVISTTTPMTQTTSASSASASASASDSNPYQSLAHPKPHHPVSAFVRHKSLHSPHPRLASSPYPSGRPQPSPPPHPLSHSTITQHHPHSPQHHHNHHHNAHHHKEHSHHAQHRQHRPSTPPSFPPGSLPYASPELLCPPSQPQTGATSPSPAQDIWALGVLLYFLLTSGALPFADAFEPRLQMKIIRGHWELPSPTEGVIVGREAEAVLRGCLEVEVARRWTINEVECSEWIEGWGQVRSRSRSRSRRPGPRAGSRSRSRAESANSGGSWAHLAVGPPGESSLHPPGEHRASHRQYPSTSPPVDRHASSSSYYGSPTSPGLYTPLSDRSRSRGRQIGVGGGVDPGSSGTMTEEDCSRSNSRRGRSRTRPVELLPNQQDVGGETLECVDENEGWQRGRQ